ncbi:MAG TPA: SDR family oxidoreductase, partial [Ramlibacter sp.]|nr:SDR family oxidoreductase [Ramlibacter sp.]
LVVGGSGGLGSAIARALARHGCRVAAAGRNREKLAAALPGACPVELDLGNHGSIAGAVADAARALDGLDLLVNAAGAVSGGRFEQTTPQQWRASLETKLLGTLEVIRAALPHLKATGGTVLTLTGSYGREPDAGQIISGAVNAALANCHKALATDLARDGVRVLSLAIGGFLTDRLLQIVSAHARDTGRTVNEQLRHAQQAHPLGRFGQPEELGEIVALLASPHCAYLTGTTLTIDGGAAHAA